VRAEAAKVKSISPAGERYAMTVLQITSVSGIRPLSKLNPMEGAMRHILLPMISLALLVGTSLTPAAAAGPRASDSTDWPGMSQPVVTGGYSSDRPDAAADCGIYDTYCYYHGRLALDNSGRNR
jgi:hypothetical protein